MSLKIAVIGAGIGGLAFSALSAKKGHQVMVFDRFPEPKPVGEMLCCAMISASRKAAIRL